MKLGVLVTCGLVLAACARPGDKGKRAGESTAPSASSSPRVALSAAPSAAPPAPPAPPAAVAGVRYFRGDDAAQAHGWRGMAVSSSEVRMLGVKTVRLVQVTQMTVAHGRTTFVGNFEGRATHCTLEPEQAAQRFTCFGKRLPYALRELRPPADNADMALMEQQIKDLTPPAGTAQR